MTITTYNDLWAHFKRIYDSGGEGKKSPYFTLFAGGIGEKDKILLWNDQCDNPEEAYQLLSGTIKQLNNPTGQPFRVFQTYKPRHNFASGEYRVQIYDNNAVVPSGVQPGISGLPGISSIADIERIVQEKQEKWELQRQVEDLQNQLSAPNTFFDKATDFIERIGATPLGQLIAARLMGGMSLPMQPMQPITGHPQQPTETETDLSEQEETFWNNIGAASTALNLTPDQLAEKLAKLLENPVILQAIKTQLQQ